MNPNQTNQPSSSQSDYGTNQDWLKKVDHEADMKNIRERLDKIESRVGSHTALADSFKEAFEKDKDVDKTLTALLSELLQKEDLKKSLSEAVNKADRTWLIARLRSIWGFVVTILLLLIGALIGRFIHP